MVKTIDQDVYYSYWCPKRKKHIGDYYSCRVKVWDQRRDNRSRTVDYFQLGDTGLCAIRSTEITGLHRANNIYDSDELLTVIRELIDIREQLLIGEKRDILRDLITED
jgi:hypothetical protein